METAGLRGRSSVSKRENLRKGEGSDRLLRLEALEYFVVYQKPSSRASYILSNDTAAPLLLTWSFSYSAPSGKCFLSPALQESLG